MMDRTIVRGLVIDFLSPSQAWPLFLHGDYLHRMSDPELRTRLRQDGQPLGQDRYEAYRSRLRPWEEADRRRLVRLMAVIADQGVNLVGFTRQTPWRFIKVAGRLDSGHPYTVGDAICLPVDFFHSSDDDQTQMWTIWHERVHVHQRQFPEPYRRLYTERWGFRQLHPPLRLTERYQRAVLTNPDGPEFEWITPLYDGWYLPVSFSDRTIHLIKLRQRSGGSGWELSDFFTMSAPEEYRRRFGHVKAQVYHPNEIAAHAIGDCLGKGICHDRFPYQWFIQRQEVSEDRETARGTSPGSAAEPARGPLREGTSSAPRGGGCRASAAASPERPSQ